MFRTFVTSVLVAACFKYLDCLDCYQCTGLHNLTDCHTLALCSSHEYCFTDARGTEDHITFTQGCRPKLKCLAAATATVNHFPLTIIGREILQDATCSQCCDLDACNKQLCTNTKVMSPLFVRPSVTTEGHYRYAAVAADHELCSKIGNHVMAVQGGTAVDAAIAAILCVGVMNAHSCGIGGGHFLTYYNRESRAVYSVMAREQAPSAATQDMFTPEKNASSTIGGKSIGIPGEILGLHEAWKLGGRLPWKLFQPTIDLCRNGITVGPALLSGMINDEELPSFRTFITNPKTGLVYKLGETMYRPKLAHTLEVTANEGPYAFYNGSLAENITLDIQEAGFQFNSTSVSDVNHALTTWHRITEGFKHAYSFRTELGDNDVGSQEFRSYVDQLVKNMTDLVFGESRRALINDTVTFPTDYYHPVFGRVWDHGTSHRSVLGPNGDAVSMTSTINLHFGSQVVGSRTGIIFNDEMDDFSTPGTLNFFGVPASASNFISPWKRPLSSMTPSIVIDANDDVKLVVGASGGTMITTSTAVVTMETLWFSWGIKEAIDYPRIHHQLFPQEIRIEKGFPQVIIDGLRKMCHNISVHPEAGSVVQGIVRTGSEITANCDFRKDGDPDGY